MEWVLDTWLLMIAQTPSDERSLDAVFLLRQIKLGHRIGLDHGREIVNQYYRNLNKYSHAAEWLGAMLRRADKTMFRTGLLPQDKRDHLTQFLKFDRSDLVFVGVAHEGTDKLLVTEESDYTPEVRRFLLTDCGVRVASIAEAIKIAE